MLGVKAGDGCGENLSLARRVLYQAMPMLSPAQRRDCQRNVTNLLISCRALFLPSCNFVPLVVNKFPDTLPGRPPIGSSMNHLG
jgi:hypothetical protein